MSVIKIEEHSIIEFLVMPSVNKYSIRCPIRSGATNFICAWQSNIFKTSFTSHDSFSATVVTIAFLLYLVKSFMDCGSPDSFENSSKFRDLTTFLLRSHKHRRLIWLDRINIRRFRYAKFIINWHLIGASKNNVKMEHTK